LDIVTVERSTWSGEVNMVIAPGVQGQLGILPHHTPLMSMLRTGELRIKQESREMSIAVTGGFIEVRPDRVIVLADAAERAEEIDIRRAEEAKKRAEQRLAAGSKGGYDEEKAKAALMRAMMRLQVAEKVERRKRRR
jgi:F-type H+-transporting ATPase subunit epsilon